jgi:hypothetical protein
VGFGAEVWASVEMGRARDAARKSGRRRMAGVYIEGRVFGRGVSAGQMRMGKVEAEFPRAVVSLFFIGFLFFAYKC